MSELSNAFDNVELRDTTKVAALDIGSNSFHLVVARIVAGSVQILHRVKQRVRLADGLDEEGNLSQEAIQRGLTTLGVIAESLQGFEPDSVRIVATYTLRKARNAKDFIRAARLILPYPIEVIPGTEEARLIYSGVAHTNQHQGKNLVIDIGGGSTEFIIGDGYDTKCLSSLPMGCVSYTKRFFKNGELKTKSFQRAITVAQQELEKIDKKFPAVGWKICTGTSGTIKVISILCQSLDDSNHESPIDLEKLENLVQACCKAGHSDALEFENVTPERRPVLAAGLAVLIAAFKSLKIKQMTYSPAALREGVIYEMEEQLTHPDIRERSAESLATRYDVDIDQAKRVLGTAMELYESCKSTWNIKKREYRNILGWSALLHEVGLQINSRGVHRHSAYILQNSDLPGFNQEQQSLLSTLARFHRKRIRLAEIPEFDQFETQVVLRLIALLRIAVILNIKRQDGILPGFDLVADEQHLSLQFPTDWLEQKPVFRADLQREIEQITALGITLDIT